MDFIECPKSGSSEHPLSTPSPPASIENPKFGQQMQISKFPAMDFIESPKSGSSDHPLSTPSPPASIENPNFGQKNANFHFPSNGFSRKSKIQIF